MSIIDQISQMVNEQFKETELQDCFLIDIVLNGKKLEVFIDTDEGIRFSKCQKFSRKLEAILDESKLIGEDYTLQVSSPGVDRPLKFRRQFPRHIGRKLELNMVEGNEVVGKFEQIDEEGLVLKVQGAKKGQFKEVKFKFEEVVSAKVLVSFKKK